MKKTALALLILIYSGFAFTQNMDKDTFLIDEVVVTGTSVKVNKSMVPLSVSVIDNKMIKSSDENSLLPVLSGKVPGLFVTERGVTGFGVATGAAGQITIRGIGGNPTTGALILIDGHPQFMGLMGHPLADSYVASDAERVEVIRGASSVLYGTNAMGGVINIITRKQQNDGLHIGARASYGSFNTQKYSVHAGYKKNKLMVFASFNHDQTDGHRANSEFDINNGYFKTGYTLNDHLNINADISIAQFDAVDPGPDTLNALTGNTIDILRGYGSLSVNNDYKKISGSAKLFYNFGEHNISDGFHSLDNCRGLNFYQALKLFKGSSITIGADFLEYGGMAENVKAMGGAGLLFVDTLVNETGLYGFVQHKINSLTLNGGIRNQIHSVYGSEWIPSGGFAFAINQKSNIRGSVSKGFRSPTIRELYMWGIANPDLKPERTINYELGYLQKIGKKLSIETTVYKITGENLIAVTVEAGVPMNRNTGEIDNTGIELSCNYFPVDDLSFLVNYSYIYMENPVIAAPVSHLYAGSTYKKGKFTFNAELQMVNDLYLATGNTEITEDYILVNLKVSYKINKYFDVFLKGENLLGQEYEINRYYGMPGVSGFAGLNFKY